MKNKVLVITQNLNSYSYWVKSIVVGLRKSADKSELILEFIDDIDDVSLSNYAINSSVIVIGYMADWLRNTLDSLIKKGFVPIMVNGWLSPSLLKICNGVYFQLGEAIEHSIRYLSLAGRKKIALFGTNEHSLADRYKEEAYAKAVKAYDLDDFSSIIRSNNSICKCVDKFIDDFVDNKIDAVICANDTSAIYLISRMVKSGFNIPDDLYVIGMGNSRLAQENSIPISSITFDYEELGYRALELWRCIHNGDTKVHAEITIPCRLISRTSTDDFICNEYASLNNQVEEKYFTDSLDEYYEDEDVQKIIRFESFLRSCDEIDFLVIKEMICGKSDFKMADSLNMSDRAIRYRINKMTKKLGVRTRDEIVKIIRDLDAFK